MKYLAPEILSYICSFITRSDLKALRLVCKAFGAAGVPKLFDELYITARYADLERASKVASRFGPFIKTLVYSAQNFTQTPWERFAPESNDPLSPDPAYPHLQAHYYTWKKLRQEKEEIGGTFGHLCHFLSVLASLQRVVLTDRSRMTGLPWCQQAYIDGQGQTFRPWAAVDFSGVKDLTRSANGRDCSERDPEAAMNQKDGIPWSDLICALYISENTNIKTLLVEPTDEFSNLAMSSFSMTPRQAFCAANVLSRLTRIRLDLDMMSEDRGGEFEHAIFHEFVAAKTLSAAVNVESLELNLNPADERLESYINPTDFNVVLGCCAFPRLRALVLKEFTFTENEMALFLRSSPVLKELSLEGLKLVSGTWGTLIDMIQATLRLDSIYLQEPLATHSGTPDERALSLCTRHPLFGYTENNDHDFNPGLQDFFFGDGLNPLSSGALQVIATARGPFAEPRAPIAPRAPTQIHVNIDRSHANVLASLSPEIEDRPARGESIFGPFSRS